MRKLRLAALLLAAAGCTRLYAGYPDQGSWLVRETPHFTFHVRPGSAAARDLDALAASAEAGYADVVSRLQLSFDGVVTYYVYPPSEAGVIGVTAGGYALPDLATIRQTYEGGGTLGEHELTHVLAERTLGRHGTRLLGEGLATALEGQYGGLSLAAWMARYAASGQLLPLDALVAGDAVAEPLFYPQAGSFVSWVLGRHGAGAVRALYPATAGDFRAAFAAATGADLESAWAEYRSTLP